MSDTHQEANGADGQELFQQLRTATAIAAEAADLAMSYFLRDVRWIEKGPADLVSEADRATEALIAEHLATAFPDDHVVGEEGTGADRDVPPGARCWYVDPIDGTTNFLKGLPDWGISMGLADAQDDLLLGVIVMPVLGSVFTAARGQGASRNGVPIHCHDSTDLGRVLVSYSVSHAADNQFGGFDAILAGMRALGEQTLGSRRRGCSVADLTSLAEGTIDVAVAGGMHKWDVAAGLLIAREAGVEVSTPDGRRSNGPDTAYVASPPGVHSQLRGILAAQGTLPTA